RTRRLRNSKSARKLRRKFGGTKYMTANTVRGNTVLRSVPKANVLIVDDNVEVLALMGSLLEANGYTYSTARSVSAMYELLKDQAFDAMLLDIQLGEE